MSFEDAAAIPITYLTAYLMLFHCCNLGARKSVLIHMAAGGVVRKTALYLVKVGRYLYLSPGKEYYLPSRFMPYEPLNCCLSTLVSSLLASSRCSVSWGAVQNMTHKKNKQKASQEEAKECLWAI